MFQIKKIFLVIVRLLFLLDGGVWSLRNLTISVPRAVLSGTEASAVLRCDYELEGAALYSLRWYRADTEFYRYVPREHPPAMVFPLTGTTVDLTQSDSNQVRLVGLNRQLSGVYQCEVSADAPLFHTDIREAPLTIVDPPFLAPKLRLHRESYSRGASISANCSVDEAYPQPNITWTLDNVPIAKTVSAPAFPGDFSERNATSHLRLTFTDDVSSGATQYDVRSGATQYDVAAYTHGTDAAVYYTTHHVDKDSSSELTVSVPTTQVNPRGTALRCVAEILGVYSRRSDAVWLREDAPAHASVTHDDTNGSRTSAASLLLMLAAMFLAL